MINAENRIFIFGTSDIFFGFFEKKGYLFNIEIFSKKYTQPVKS